MQRSIERTLHYAQNTEIETLYSKIAADLGITNARLTISLDPTLTPFGHSAFRTKTGGFV